MATLNKVKYMIFAVFDNNRIACKKLTVRDIKSNFESIPRFQGSMNAHETWEVSTMYS